MSFVLAQQKEWPADFQFEIQDNFKNLRDGVNNVGDVKPTDAFMWEIFTTKKYYDNGELKQIGHIYTPWPSWVITASADVTSTDEGTTALRGFFSAVNEGIQYFNSHQDEAVTHISTHLDYTADDARAWLDTVKFVNDVSTIDQETVINKTIKTLQAAEVLTQGSEGLAYTFKP